MSDKIVMISELTFDEAQKKAFDMTSDLLANAVDEGAFKLDESILITMIIAAHTSAIKENLFGKNED